MPELPEIIDFHVHLCRSVEEEKLVFPRVGWPDEWYWGNPADVVPYMNAWTVSHVVTLNVMDTGAMTRAHLAKSPDATPADISAFREKMRDRVRKFNTWACDVHRAEPRIIPFIYADPILFNADVTTEIDRCAALGAVGVKIHPNISGHYPADPAALPIYDLASDLGLIVLTDTDGQPGAEGEHFGSPVAWQPVLRQFKNFKLVLAHLCGQRWDEQIALAAEFGDNVFWDMSGGFVDATHPPGPHREMPIEEGQRVFRKIGAERILFGTDGPALRREVPDTVCQLLQLRLTDDENLLILRNNAATLLGL
ncbi:MAG TPA: amidohydrolase family protein [Acidimicrobiales bacterium]|nr:amidohydrolase family protein [Acidimicrobiales bacterium]